MSEEKNEYTKPLPDFRPETKPFWDGTKEHKLLLPKCKETGKVFFYPRAIPLFQVQLIWTSIGSSLLVKVQFGHTLFITWALLKLTKVKHML